MSEMIATNSVTVLLVVHKTVNKMQRVKIKESLEVNSVSKWKVDAGEKHKEQTEPGIVCMWRWKAQRADEQREKQSGKNSLCYV